MNLAIITPDEKVYDGAIKGVQVPGVTGSFEVLENHAPLVSALETGILRVTDQKGQHFFEIDNGVIEVLNNSVVILAETIKRK